FVCVLGSDADPGVLPAVALRRGPAAWIRRLEVRALYPRRVAADAGRRDRRVRRDRQADLRPDAARHAGALAIDPVRSVLRLRPRVRDQDAALPLPRLAA